ncbi:MAG TPA: hypothetical protein PKL13_03985 [bacterium]|nr:hypothetical protein [bacterium]
MKNYLEKIKDYYIRINIAILMLGSIFLFLGGFINSNEPPWWFNLICGWSGLTVSLKLSKIWYKN